MRCRPGEFDQYTSAEFNRYGTRVDLRPSMGRTGVCWDNAAAESFFATLKNEIPPSQIYHPSPRPVRGRGLHRGLLQPNQAAQHAGLQDAAALTAYQTSAVTEAA